MKKLYLWHDYPDPAIKESIKFFFSSMYPDCWESWFELYEMAYVGHKNSRELFFDLWDKKIAPHLDEKVELKLGHCSPRKTNN